MNTSIALAAPVNDTVASVKGAIILDEIRTKDRTVRGVTYPGEVTKGHRAEIVPGKSIRLFGTCPAGLLWVGPAGAKVQNEAFDYSRDFAVGDEVIVGGTNFAYFGTILAITAATVTVTRTGKTARLPIQEFDHLNWRRTVAAEKIERGLWQD